MRYKKMYEMSMRKLLLKEQALKNKQLELQNNALYREYRKKYGEYI